MKELLLFEVGTMQLGTNLASVKSIQGAPPIDAKPAEVHNMFASVVNGLDFSLYDLVSLLGDKNSSTDQHDEKLIVFKTQDQPVGMIVDRVDRVVTVDSDRIEQLPPIFKGPAQSCFPNVLKLGDKLVLLLAPEGIVNFGQEMQRLQDLQDGLDFEKAVENRSEAESALSSINPEEESVAAYTQLETVLSPAEMEVGLDLPPPDMQTALPAKNVETKSDLLPVDMGKELEVAATEIGD
jgi:chemotaxis signal transduction protein